MVLTIIHTKTHRSPLNTGWAKKLDHFYEFITPTHDIRLNQGPRMVFLNLCKQVAQLSRTVSESSQLIVQIWTLRL